MRKFAFLVLSLFLALVSNLTFAKEDKSESATPAAEKCARLQASTVFVSDKGKNGSADKLTESHKNAASQGWNFDEMSLYIEDGDLQGFYVTYTRPHPCNNK